MKVLLIDDHGLFREGLALLLQPLQSDLTIWQAASCEQAFDMLQERGPTDLALVDLELPGMHGLDGISTLRTRWPETILVALSSVDDRDTVLRAVDRGAMGFIPKSATPAVLIAALQLILARGVYLPPSAFVGAPTVPQTPRPAPIGSSRRAVTDNPPGLAPSELGLTPRQIDVLLLILEGKPAKLIERALNLSASTVKAHTSAVLRALNVTTRTQAVVAAGRLALRFDPVAPAGFVAGSGAE